MKRGIFAAFLFLVGSSTSWGEDLIEKDHRILDINEIEVQKDQNVRPPVLDNESMEKRGRIVINLRNDGFLTGKDFQVLETDEAIKDYITKSKDQFVAAGKEPVLHLRGEADTVFKGSRKVIRISSDAGVSQVVFAVYQKPEAIAAATDVELEDRIEVAEIPDEVIKLPRPEGDSLIDFFIKPREQDLGMSLPANDGGKVEGKAVFIQLNAQGQVFLGKEKLALDQDAESREMPLLKAELEKLKEGGEKLAVKIYVDRGTVQQRVIDLLNALAAVDISTVTFSDEIEK